MSTTAAIAAPSDYSLGAGEAERRRLIAQCERYRPEAERLFDRIGVGRGWRALDMGCGPLGVLDVLAGRTGRLPAPPRRAPGRPGLVHPLRHARPSLGKEAMTSTDTDVEDLCIRARRMMADGTLADFEHATMSGRHLRPTVGYGPDARPAQAFPATGRRFAGTRTHWFRIADGMIVDHRAGRDALGTATQLGGVRPSPRYLVPMLPATRRARSEVLR